MNAIRIGVPIIATACLTVGCAFLTIWLTDLVPEGDWAGLIRAILVIGVALGALVAIAWSAYFSLILRRTLKS